MELLIIFQAHPWFFIATIAIVGLMVGSFLNVVIYRVPVMMQRHWQQECHEYLELPAPGVPEEPLNLSVPASRCNQCHTPIKPQHNIPVLSYLFLRGKCANCRTSITVRYPLVELFTGIISAVVAWHFGYSVETFFALILSWSLIALSGIDIDHQLLPDSIILPLLWLGLLLSLFSIFSDSHSSIIGAIAGYLSLWTVFQLFKLATGKEGMGYGDFKLLALFGAWLGWQYLPVIILLSSLVGATIGISMVVFGKHDHQKPIPFGPYLAAAGWLVLMWGNEINQLYLGTVGL